MNTIDLKFKALSIFIQLETQLACLHMGLPVPNHDGGTYNTSSPMSEPFSYWKSYLIREAFYQMFQYTSEIEVFCLMLEWLDSHNDQAALEDGLSAVKCIQQLSENEMRNAVDQERAYKMEYLTEEAARLRLIEHADEVSSISSYADLLTLSPEIIGIMIEYEYLCVSLVDSNDILIDGHTSSHHCDTLNLLHSAYKKHPWVKACRGTIFEFDEGGELDEFYIPELQEALISSEKISSSGARVLFG